MVANRLPEEAKQVLEETRKELRNYIFETELTKENRLERAFDRVAQGHKSHAEFRAEFQSVLLDLDKADMLKDYREDRLKREYLRKLNHDLRTTVMSRDWPLDGPKDFQRGPKTWTEVAKVCNMILEQRGDLTASGPGQNHDAFYAIDASGRQLPPTKGAGKGGKQGNHGDVTCKYCHRVNEHYTEACPQKVADERGESKECLAANQRTVSYTHLTLPTIYSV